MAGLTTAGRSYSGFASVVFLFNLVVGIGVLAMPTAFQKAGVVLASLFTALLAFLSYLTTTFVIEAMAVANAITLKPGQVSFVVVWLCPSDQLYDLHHKLEAAVSHVALFVTTCAE